MGKAKMLAVAAMCIALAFALNQVSLFRMPQGGSVTPFSMMFIALAGYWLGPVWGIVTGVSMGLLDLTTGFASVHVGSIILDYPLAFGALGLAGLFRKVPYGLQIGYVVGVAGRFLSVAASGYLFWLERLPGSLWGSITYNAAYILPEMIATLVIISLPAVKHAVNEVTRTVVPPADYAHMVKVNSGSISAGARVATGAVIGIVGGMAFVLVSYIRRLEMLSIMQYTTGAELFYEAPRRIPRMIERNTEQIFALGSAGVVLLAISAGLLIWALADKKE